MICKLCITVQNWCCKFLISPAHSKWLWLWCIYSATSPVQFYLEVHSIMYYVCTFCMCLSGWEVHSGKRLLLAECLLGLTHMEDLDSLQEIEGGSDPRPDSPLLFQSQLPPTGQLPECKLLSSWRTFDCVTCLLPAFYSTVYVRLRMVLCGTTRPTPLIEGTVTMGIGDFRGNILNGCLCLVWFLGAAAEVW